LGFSERTKSGLSLAGSEGKPSQVSIRHTLTRHKGELTICDSKTAALAKVLNAGNLALTLDPGKNVLAELGLLDKLLL
jgi:hypothetical protein